MKIEISQIVGIGYPKSLIPKPPTLRPSETWQQLTSIFSAMHAPPRILSSSVFLAYVTPRLNKHYTNVLSVHTHLHLRRGK